MSKHDVTAAYAGFFKGWHAPMLGAKPTAAQLEAAHALDCRQGSKVALALAMYLRPAGATQGQVVVACGGPQLNKLRGLITAKRVARLPMPAVAGHTVYRIALLKGKAPKPGKSAKPRATQKRPTTRKPAKPVTTAPAATDAA